MKSLSLRSLMGGCGNGVTEVFDMPLLIVELLTKFVSWIQFVSTFIILEASFELVDLPSCSHLVDSIRFPTPFHHT